MSKGFDHASTADTSAPGMVDNLPSCIVCWQTWQSELEQAAKHVCSHTLLADLSLGLQQLLMLACAEC